MKINSIQNNVSYKSGEINSAKNFSKKCNEAQFQSFMKEIDIWTKANLGKIDKKYKVNSFERKHAIENLLNMRDIRIKAKKLELFPPKQTIPLWRRALVFLGILNY